MLRRLALPALLALAACSSSDATAPKGLTLTGDWTQSSDLREPVTGDTLILLGRFQLVQSGDAFSGTGSQQPVCTASATSHDGPLADPSVFGVSSGALTGRAVIFQRDICTYQGSFVDGRSDRITGTASCSYARNGTTYNYSGQWQATRQ
jgi:hypothetical protein